MAFYDRERITEISWTVVTIRKDSGHPNWFALSEVEENIDRRCGDHLMRCFAGRELLARDDDEALLATSPQVSPQLRLEQSFAPSADGWAAVTGRLATAEGLPVSSGIDAHVSNLVIRCDGKTTVREVLRRSAEDAELPSLQN